jgi:sugar transferase (PEP-CTERM system associated)
LVAASLSKEDQTVRVVGFYPGHVSEELAVPENLVVSRDKSLIDTVSELNVDEIVVAIGERRGGRLPLRELLDCRLSGVLVLDMSSHFERMLGQIRLDALRAGWLIFGGGFRQGTGRTMVKRIFDIVAALILLILFSPLMLVTAVLIVLEDGFPIFYRQERVGLNGRLFNVIKFRSMGRDAESDGQPRWAAKNDDRVTRIGRVIRKLRIDELPQLFSVLAGHMSMVGPRPERAFFVDQLTKEIPFYAVRHSVKPGVTGWAQVRYHYGSTVDDAAQKLQYDLYYVKNHTLLLDLVVLFETVGVVVGGKGAQ